MKISKKTWKHINLFLHPDKAEPSQKLEAEVRFKACSKAFETLTTPLSRVDYDSHYKFDEAIPSAVAGTKSVEDFLRIYTPIFDANARFSKNKPVPQLGDAKMTEKQLLAFYNFWQTFQSWREFPQGDTEKCGDSASRDERRRAEQKNKKGRETLKAAEMKRVRLFVERAQAADPRLKAFKASKATKSPTGGAAAGAKSPTPAAAAGKGLPPGLQAKAAAAAAAKAEQDKKTQATKK